MKRIAFVGGPGSGKTTLAHDVFVRMKKLGYNTEIVPEWIRRDIMINGPMLTVFEQYRTLMYHRKEEEHFPEQVQFLIQDGGTLTGYFYAALYSNGQDRKERLVVQDLYTTLLDDLYSRKYDLIYFVPRIENMGNLNDGTRFQSAHEFQVLDSFMKLFFTEVHSMPNVRLLDCPLDHRTDEVCFELVNGEVRPPSMVDLGDDPELDQWSMY